MTTQTNSRRPRLIPTKGKGRKLTFFGKLIIFTALLTLQVYLIFFKPIDTLDPHHYINDIPLPLFGTTKTVWQEFHSPGSLSRIDVMLANYKVKPQNSTLRFSIFRQDQRLFLKNYPANTIEDNRFFSFHNIPDNIPAGNYRFQLQFFPANKSTKLAVWISKNNLYASGKLYVNDKPHPGDVTFRLYYRSTLWNSKDHWLTPPHCLPFHRYALGLGFLLMLFMVNFLFYYFLNKLLDVPDTHDDY